MMNELDFAQFKLASGHEVVCEVLEWTDPAYLTLKKLLLKMLCR